METRISDLIQTLRDVKKFRGNVRVVAASDEELNRITPVAYSVVELSSGEIVFCTHTIPGGDIE